MAFAITGAKYASASLNAVGTTTVTVSTAPFVSGDFTVTRLVGLWNSAGTAFKGMAWVRRFVSTNQLQLQTQFFDPATGATVTQVSGDTILVSKNFAESVVAGLAVSGRTVTLTDQCTFGTTVSNGVCFYDESKEITTNNFMLFQGGLTVFGKLDNYSTNSTSNACDVYITTAANSSAMRTNDATSNFCMYGGILSGTNSPIYVGGYQGTTGYTMIFNGVQNPFDFISPGAGGSWGSNQSRQQLVNCYSVTEANNAIMRRWGDGVISGGQYKFPNNTNGPISVFGSDSAGTYTVAAPAGTRAVVLDMGGGPALVRSSVGLAVNFNFTNLVTTDFRTVGGQNQALSANNGGTNTFAFSDTYTSLQPGTVGVILNSSSAVAASNASTGTSWSPSLLRRTTVGATDTINSTSWTYGLKDYGYQVVSGTITPTTYDLGTAGSADNVIFGGAVNQLPDPNVTLSQSAANALASIATLDNLYDAAVNWATLSVTNAQYPSLVAYPITASGAVLNLGSRNLVIDPSASAAFAVNTGTNTITIKSSVVAVGSKFTSLTTTGSVTLNGGAVLNTVYTSSAGTSCVLTFTGLTSGSSIYVQPNNSLATQYVGSTGTTQVVYIAPNNGAAGSASYKIALYGKVSTGFVNFTPQGAVNVAITMDTDPGITQATAGTVAAYTSLANLDRLYDYAAYWETTSTGITFTRLVSKSSAQVNLGAINLTTNNSGAVWAVGGTAPTATTLTINVGSTFVAGSTFATLGTTGSLTLGSGVTIGFVYTTGAGTSAVLQLSGIPASSSTVGQAYVYIANGSGVQQVYQAVSGTYSLAVAPGASGTWSWKVAQYGKISASGTLTPGSGGTFTTTVNLLADGGITNTAVSSGTPAVASATTLSTLDTIYDYSAYWETTNAGIVYNRVATQQGAQIIIGAVNFTYNTAASGVWTVGGTAPTATALTVKGATLTNGTTFTSIKTTGTATISASTTNQAIVYSSSGNSGIVTITGLISTAVYLQDNSATQRDYQSSITGTYTFYTPIGSTGTWTWVIKRSGYSYVRGTISPSVGGFFTAAPPSSQKLNADGTVMYTASTNALLSVAYVGSTTEADINIGNGAVSVQNVLDVTETSLSTNAGMIWLTVNGECSQFLSSNGNFIFLSTKWRFKALNTSSPNATVNGFAISADGTPLNAANGTVTFLSSTTASDVAAAVWNALATTYNTAGTMGNVLNDADIQAKLAAALSA